VHAPRQTGKTTTLAALAQALTAEGEYLALHFSCECAGPAGDDYPAAQRSILGSLRLAATNAGVAPELIRWPYQDPDGKRVWQWEAVELKVWRPDQPTDPTPDGLRQLDAYLDRLRLDHGTLVVFDRRPTALPLAERIGFTTAQTPIGRPVTLLRA
jgi:hypothetical protein